MSGHPDQARRLELETADAIDDGEVAVAALVAGIFDGGLTGAKEAGAAAGSLPDNPVACGVDAEQEVGRRRGRKTLGKVDAGDEVQGHDTISSRVSGCPQGEPIRIGIREDRSGDRISAE